MPRPRFASILFLLLGFSAFGGATAGSTATADVSGQKAVLITGASTGIGRNIAEHLASQGYFVYAGARKEADLKELNGIENIQAVRLDVTKLQDIAAAVELVKKGGRGLYGLINNAGVATTGSVIDTDEKELDLVMEVNVYGPFRITKAFAPLIIEQKGRIVTIGSISGFNGTPNFSTYVMSKHAMEGFTDSLAPELAPLGVHVSIIEPGGYNSEIFKSAVERGALDAKVVAGLKLKEPDDVARAAMHALFDPDPKRRYMVVSTEREAEITVTNAINKLVQVNEGQRYTYDRDTLVRMLDEALAGARPRVE